MNDKREDIILSGKIIDEGSLINIITENITEELEGEYSDLVDLWAKQVHQKVTVELTGNAVTDLSIFTGVEDDNNEIDTDSIKDEDLSQSKKFHKEGTILESIIYAIEPNEEEKKITFFTEYNSFDQILISDKDFYYKGSLKEDYDKISPREQYQRKYNMACTLIGSRISYVITGIEKIKGSKGRNKYRATASRVIAGEIIKEHYFFNEDGPKVNVGDIVYPKIMSLNRIWAKVEVLGIETNMHREMLTSTKWIKDCTKDFRVGQKIDAVITKISIDEKNKDVKLVLSRKYLVKSSVYKKNLKKIKLGSIILGEVVSYNPEKEVATAILRGEILCAIPQHKFIGGKRLYPGDKISAIVLEVNHKEGYVIATAKLLSTKYEI